MQMPSRGTSMRERVRRAGLASVLLATLASPHAHAAPEALTAQVDDPRAFGYTVGDVITRRIHLQVPAGLQLDAGSLPAVGRRGTALELRSVELARNELTLAYQVFVSPREPRVLEMPPLALRFVGLPREQSLRIDAWPVSVSPLVAAEAPSRQGLGDLRPDAAPPLIDTAATRARLTAYGAVLALLLAYLAHVYIALPWWARGQRPFAQAWRQLQALPSHADLPERRAAWARMHEALNRTAGEVVFASSVDRLMAAAPQLAELRAELLQFFERSTRVFFANASAPVDDDLAWLLAFCRRCRDAERGAA